MSHTGCIQTATTCYSCGSYVQQDGRCKVRLCYKCEGDAKRIELKPPPDPDDFFKDKSTMNNEWPIAGERHSGK